MPRVVHLIFFGSGRVFVHHGVMSKVHDNAHSARLKIEQEIPTTTAVFAGSIVSVLAETDPL